jgi:PAS domain S-box-containing protein
MQQVIAVREDSLASVYESASLWSRWVIVTGALSIHTLLFIPSTIAFGVVSGLFLIIPAALAGWWFGIKGGFLAGMIGTVLHGLLLILGANVVPSTILNIIPVFALLPTSGVLVGMYQVERTRLRELELARAEEIEKYQYAQECRRSTESELRESEERFRALIEASPDGIMLTDTSGGIIMANRQMSIMHGYDSVEAMLAEISDADGLLDPDDAERMRREIDTLCAEGRNRRGEYRLLRKDGGTFPSEISFSLLRSTQGEQCRIITISRDMTQRVCDEHELIRARDKAEESERLKDAFLRNVSHEIRTPINIILGFAGMLELELPRAEEGDIAMYFSSIKRASERLMRTVELILNVSRLQAGTFQAQRIPCDLVEIARRIVDDYQPISRDRNLQLVEHSECACAPILADTYTLQQALANVIDNAIKFTPEGGVSVRVWQEDEDACISITDTGVGISGTYLPDIFSVFSQEDVNYTRPFDGIGLGLSLTRQYVEHNAGRIDISSKKDAGTTVVMRFPLRVERRVSASTADASETVAAAPPRTEALSGDGRRHTILVVEDDMPTQVFMNALLSRFSSVHFANCADEAIIILNTEQIDLVLMDVSLPGEMDGLQLTRHLRSVDCLKDLPIVALTGHAFELDRTNALRAGCNAFLTKPFQIAELTALIRSLLPEEVASKREVPHMADA